MKKQILLILLMALSLPALAAGQVNYLDVKNGIVLFATDEAKSTTSPSCVMPENASQWALSLQNDTGRATYSLLMTAMATKMAIAVETAADCNDAEGFERPNRVWLETTAEAEPELTPTIDTVTTFKTVGYGAISRSKCRVFATTKSPGGVSYMTRYDYSNGNSHCQCNEGAKSVTVSSTDYRFNGDRVVDLE